MPDVSQSKKLFCEQMIDISKRALNIIEDMDAINAAFSVHGFQQGGPNQFTDADFKPFINLSHLTAAIVFDVLFSIGTIVGEINTGQRNSLRECIPGGLP